MFQSSRAISPPATAGNPPSMQYKITEGKHSKNVPIIFQYIKSIKIFDQLCLYNTYLTNEIITKEI